MVVRNSAGKNPRPPQEAGKMKSQVLAAAVGAVLVFPAGAEATSYNTCRYGTYGSEEAYPIVQKLRVRAARKIDGYAPRCLVAETVAWKVVAKANRRVRAYGARWNAGAFVCAYGRLHPTRYEQRVACRNGAVTVLITLSSEGDPS